MKRKMMLFLLLASCVFLLVNVAWPQGKYPEKRIEALVGYTPGNYSDNGARVIVDGMQKIFGTADNHPK